MKRVMSITLCFVLLLSCAIPAMAANDVPEEVMEATKSVVRILSQYYNGAATGSGFVIKNEPGEVLIATNNHVVEGNPTSISVWIAEDELVEAEIVFTTAKKDLCVLKITNSVDMQPLTLSKEDVRQGQAVYAVGYPGVGDILSDSVAHTSEAATITDGIISAIRTFTIEEGADPTKLLQINAAINPGNSGGPLFNAKGEVIGVNTYKVNKESQGIFGAVDISELWTLLRRNGIEIPEKEAEPETEPEPVATPKPFPVGIAVGAAGALVLLAVVIILANRKKPKRKNYKQKTQQTVTLLEYLQNYPQGLGIGGAVSLLLPAGIALRNYHNDGKLHLEICPENILVGDHGAALKNPSGQEAGRFHSGFAAPEIYKGAGYGITSDIYSFGAVLYFAATGKAPANSLQQDMLEKDFDVVEDAAFAQVLRKSMASSVLDRTQSMQEMIYSIAVFNVPEEAPKAAAQVVEDVLASVTEAPVVVPGVETVKKTPIAVKAEKPQKEAKKLGKILLPIGAVLACVAVAAVMLLWKPISVTEEEMAVTLESTEQTEVIELSEEEIKYNEALAWAEDGQYGKAAIAFAKLDGYADAREMSFACWKKVPNRCTISFGTQGFDGRMFHALREDGTIAIDMCASDKLSDADIAAYCTANYRDIVSLHGVVGLKYDGTLALPYEDMAYYQELSEWTDIVALSVPFNPYEEFYVGLKTDGTVVAVGTNKYGECDVSEWTNITAICAGEDCTFGVKSDGTVVATGWDVHGKCSKVAEWTDIQSVASFDVQTFGLKSDGSVVAVGGNYNGAIEKAKNWNNIAALGYGGEACAVKKDGTVVGTFLGGGWKNIVSIITTDSRDRAVLRADGTVDLNCFAYEFTRAKKWTDIQVPTISEEPIRRQTDKEKAYAEAEELLAAGETAKAAIAFGKLGDYSDVRERSFELWREVIPQQTISAGLNSIAAVRSDGTVLLAGYADSRQRQCQKWSDIVAVSTTAPPEAGHTVGLKSDGTVVAVGANQWEQCNTFSWSDIVAIGTGALYTVGLTADGTVLYSGHIKNTNTNQIVIQKLSSWTDIVAISTSSNSVFGLKSDGTVVVADGNHSHMEEVVKDWSDIVAISVIGNHVAGLKADGTVIETRTNDDIQSSVSHWSDITAIATGLSFTIGLKSDGTVVSTGQTIDVSDWSDIAAICAYGTYAIGVKNDGSMVSAGEVKDSVLIKNWTDIKLPN